MFLKNPQENGIFGMLAKAVSDDAVSAGETRDIIYEAASHMISEAEKYSYRGDLWEIQFALAAAGEENPIARAYERMSVPKDVFGILARDLWTRHKVVTSVKAMVSGDSRYAPLARVGDFEPLKKNAAPGTGRTRDAVMTLAARFAAAGSPEDMSDSLADFSAVYGAGKFALSEAFVWDSPKQTLEPVDDLDPGTLDSLVGYETQKRELLSNTESFLNGNPPNNVLLFGDSGTGKSSSVRALLNEPDFVRRGLRMVEPRHDQFAEIPAILKELRQRNYRFILFMDDLSFEEFETGYKRLKVIIEGGLERKPDNVIVCATSNRRNIVREVWQERAVSNDDVHGRDTMQEKHSLVDRFGLAIWYPSAGKNGYLSIVKALSEEMGLVMSSSEMETLAMRWELERGGFTGRTARQFVCRMLQGRISIT
ncbi:MAG: ATP-binding protein [Synergistaceae bacterium]|nr:ATP-binding protein [Synergistaceae bacterium]